MKPELVLDYWGVEIPISDEQACALIRKLYGNQKSLAEIACRKLLAGERSVQLVGKSHDVRATIKSGPSPGKSRESLR